MRFGHGTYIDKNKNEYVGTFLNDLKHGEGVLIYF